VERNLNALLDVLRESAGLRLVTSRLHIKVRAASHQGFDVSVWRCGGIYSVGFAGWRCHTQHQDAAVDLICMAYSPACRLRVDSRGGIDYCWQVECEVDMQWSPGHVSRRIFYPYWGAHGVRFLSNEPIPGLPAWVPMKRRHSEAA